MLQEQIDKALTVFSPKELRMLAKKTGQFAKQIAGDRNSPYFYVDTYPTPDFKATHQREGIVLGYVLEDLVCQPIINKVVELLDMPVHRPKGPYHISIAFQRRAYIEHLDNMPSRAAIDSDVDFTRQAKMIIKKIEKIRKECDENKESRVLDIQNQDKSYIGIDIDDLLRGTIISKIEDAICGHLEESINTLQGDYFYEEPLKVGKTQNLGGDIYLYGHLKSVGYMLGRHLGCLTGPEDKRPLVRETLDTTKTLPIIEKITHALAALVNQEVQKAFSDPGYDSKYVQRAEQQTTVSYRDIIYAASPFNLMRRELESWVSGLYFTEPGIYQNHKRTVLVEETKRESRLKIVSADQMQALAEYTWNSTTDWINQRQGDFSMMYHVGCSSSFLMQQIIDNPHRPHQMIVVNKYADGIEELTRQCAETLVKKQYPVVELCQKPRNPQKPYLKMGEITWQR